MENKKEIDVEIESLEALKNIEKNSERTAKNVAFFAWIMITSIFLSIFLIGVKQ